MAYQPSTPSKSSLSQYASISGATTAVFGTFYDCTGSTPYVVTGPAAPTSGMGVFALKVDASASSALAVTFTPPSGMTVDGATSFAVSGPGTEYVLYIAAGASDYKIA